MGKKLHLPTGFAAYLPVTDMVEARKNLRANRFFPLSAAAFFLLNNAHTAADIAAFAFAIPMLILLMTQFPSIRRYGQAATGRVKLWAGLTTAAAAVNSFVFFLSWNKVPATEQIKDQIFTVFATPDEFQYVTGAFGTLLSIPFIYYSLAFFAARFRKLWVRIDLFRDIGRQERRLYAVLLVGLCLFMIYAYTQSDAFYATRLSRDVIYTSDSPFLFKKNAYLSVTHSENDIKQPLFAYFAAPFMGIPYLLGLPCSWTVRAILAGVIQISLLMLTLLLFARFLGMTRQTRVCFVLLCVCSFPCMLFSVMLEQYIVANFWLALFLCSAFDKGREPSRLATIGACGCLTTNIILLPLLGGTSPRKDFKKWAREVLPYASMYLFSLIALARFDVLCNLKTKTEDLLTLTGAATPLRDRLYQYLAFIRSCTIAPASVPAVVVAARGLENMQFLPMPQMAWVQQPVASMDILGAVILSLCIATLAIDRKRDGTKILAIWLGMSFILLGVIGWGTAENSLILYTLYFGWAVIAIMSQLLEKLEQVLHAPWLGPVATAPACGAMLYFNVPAVLAMLDFARTYFPL